MAPELAQYKMGPKNDVWSIGIIVYLLITGGVADKRHEEYFDFKEPIWYNVSEELKEFIMMTVCVDPSQRASIDELLETDFIKMSTRDDLDKTPLDETNLTELGGNMYKFYMAHCLNEIVSRFRLNADKRKEVNTLKESMFEVGGFAIDNHQPFGAAQIGKG